MFSLILFPFGFLKNDEWAWGAVVGASAPKIALDCPTLPKIAEDLKPSPDQENYFEGPVASPESFAQDLAAFDA